MSPQALLQCFDEGTLDPAAFSHRDHAIVAWQALSEDEFFQASTRVARGLRQLTVIAGVPEKFNATITHAFMSMIAEQKARSEAGDAETFLQENPGVLDSGFLKLRYTEGRLSSDLARQVALLPDR